MKTQYVCYIANKKTEKQFWFDTVTELALEVGKWNAKGYDLVGTVYDVHRKVVYLEKGGELWNENKDWTKSYYDPVKRKVYGWSC